MEEEDSVNNGKSFVSYNEMHSLHDPLDLMKAIMISRSLIVVEGQSDTVSSKEQIGEKEEATESTDEQGTATHQNYILVKIWAV